MAEETTTITKEVEDESLKTTVEAEREVGEVKNEITHIKDQLTKHASLEQLGEYRTWTEQEIARLDSKSYEVPMEVMEKLTNLENKIAEMISAKSSESSETLPPKRVETQEQKPKEKAPLTRFLHRLL